MDRGHANDTGLLTEIVSSREGEFDRSCVPLGPLPTSSTSIRSPTGKGRVRSDGRVTPSSHASMTTSLDHGAASSLYTLSQRG